VTQLPKFRSGVNARIAAIGPATPAKAYGPYKYMGYVASELGLRDEMSARRKGAIGKARVGAALASAAKSKHPVRNVRRVAKVVKR
jgi:hypothetical protein